MAEQSHRTGILLMLGATLAWSTAGLFARAIPLDTPTVIFWRGMFGAAGLIGLLIAMKGLSGLRDFTRLGGAGAAYAFASGIGVLSFVGALKSTTIAHVAIIYATVPFAAAALGWGHAYPTNHPENPAHRDREPRRERPPAPCDGLRRQPG